MTGDIVKSDLQITPVPVTLKDGVVVKASVHLNAIHYPNRLNGIAVLGRKQPWQRIFLLRPEYGGEYVFLMYPSNMDSFDRVIKKTIIFPNFNSAPETLVIDIPHAWQDCHIWRWKLIKITSALDESSYEAMADMLKPGDGMLFGQSSDVFSKYAIDRGEFASLILDVRAAMDGLIKFSEEVDGNVSRLIAWSCHQPYQSNANGPALRKNIIDKLAWYRDRVENFDPHRVWALGDTCYSDGTSSLNFVAQLEDKPGWHKNWDLRKDLLSLYRLNYRYHWSFDSMQKVMRQFPHLAMWDDHELRDGFGSDQGDRNAENRALKEVASQAAEEYLFQLSPKLRSESDRSFEVDNHQAYIDAPIASFIFDGRNSRDYGDDLAVPADVSYLIGFVADLILGKFLGTPYKLATKVVGSPVDLVAELNLLYRWHNPGEVVSDKQLADFERFCQHLKGQRSVKYLIMGNSVPFIFIMDFIESFAAEALVTSTSIGQHIRDDIRDSWHSPANRRQLSKLMSILCDLHRARPDIEMFNISGDIHISNAFAYQPEGFEKPLYQITSSALTNEPSMSQTMSDLLSVGGPISFNAKSEVLGDISRIWHEGELQNFLSVDADEQKISFHLHVFNNIDGEVLGDRDIQFTVIPGTGYEIRRGAG